ncbi:MAG: tyrosine-type recombinase/integrase, partial [Candidatus Aenigmatarchaeota archaeon]
MDMNLSPNEEIAEKFYEFCVSENLSKSRIDKHRHALRNICKWLEVGFKEATREDIEKLVAKINLSDYADWTKRDHRKTLKKFYKWLEGDGEEFPKKVRWIKLGQVNNKKTAEEMLTQEEVKRLIESASNIRDKAIIAILYESGCRIGELVGLKIKSVVFKDNNLVHIQVTGKTGYRPIPLVSSVPYLSTWINNHPTRNDPEAKLLVSVGTINNGKPIKQ